MIEKITLLQPHDEAVVDGRDITFEWEDAGSDSTYVLQVAADLDFADILFEQVYTNSEPVHLIEHFTDAGEVHFWRIIVRRHGSEVISDAASFTARRRDSIPEFIPVVDPASISAGVEPEGVDVKPIINAVGLMAIFLVIAVSILFNWLNLEYQDAVAESITPAVNPVVRDAVVEAEKNITQYGNAGPGTGAFRIPVDKAIDIISNEAYVASDSAFTSELRLK